MCGKIKVPGVLQYYPLFKQKLKHIEVIKKKPLNASDFDQTTRRTKVKGYLESLFHLPGEQYWQAK